MKTIYKYELTPIQEVQRIPLPKGSQILSVMNQKGSVVVYAAVDPGEKKHEDHIFYTIGTGQSAEKVIGANFIGTVQVFGNAIVLHIFYKKAVSIKKVYKREEV